MIAGSLRGIRPGAVVKRVYFEVESGDTAPEPFDTFDGAMERAAHVRSSRVEYLRRLVDMGSPVSEDRPVFACPPVVRVRMRWVITNADGVEVDCIVDAFDLQGEGE